MVFVLVVVDLAVVYEIPVLLLAFVLVIFPLLVYLDVYLSNYLVPAVASGNAPLVVFVLLNVLALSISPALDGDDFHESGRLFAFHDNVLDVLMRMTTF